MGRNSEIPTGLFIYPLGLKIPHNILPAKFTKLNEDNENLIGKFT